MALQARTEFASALNQIASEKGVDASVVIEAIEQAALAAFRKDLSLRGQDLPETIDDFTAKIDPLTGEIGIFDGTTNVTPPGFARIAAQTAKQVIMQRLHEAEKGAIMEEYDKKVGQIISGTIQRQEGNTYFVDLGRAEGVLPPSEQTRDEYLHVGQRLKFYIKEIRESGRGGPEVIVSRTDAGLVKGLFAMEVPEIQAGTVVIKEIAREAGGRTKISAISTQDGVDPVGSLVGQKGVRVQTVINELGEEKVDIVPFSEDPAKYIVSALAPAKDVSVFLDMKNEDKIAKVKIPASQMSLAIGKGGQNVRLAAKLTGYKIDIESEEDVTTQVAEAEKGTAEKEVQADDAKTDDSQVQVAPAQTDEEGRVEAEAATNATPEATEVAVENAVSEAMAEESLDGAVVEEPTPEEPGMTESMADAEADMSAADVEGSTGTEDPDTSVGTEADMAASDEAVDTTEESKAEETTTVDESTDQEESEKA
jgi:transcription termination/antitermination protein NusA